MCGIVGYAGKTNVIKNIMTGLKSLEYRGYDSSGIAYLDKNNNIKIYKKVGQIKNLDQILNYEDEASLGISHTRWATHGGVTDTNAHPHNQGKITLVHNGIIENYEELKKELEKEGYNFKSSTDSEVAAALIDKLYKENKDMLKTLVILKDKLKGSYAFNIINSDIKNKSRKLNSLDLESYRLFPDTKFIEEFISTVLFTKDFHSNIHDEWFVQTVLSEFNN